MGCGHGSGSRGSCRKVRAVPGARAGGGGGVFRRRYSGDLLGVVECGGGACWRVALCRCVLLLLVLVPLLLVVVLWVVVLLCVQAVCAVG